MSRRISASSSTTRMRGNITPGRAPDGSILGQFRASRDAQAGQPFLAPNYVFRGSSWTSECISGGPPPERIAKDRRHSESIWPGAFVVNLSRSSMAGKCRALEPGQTISSSLRGNRLRNSVRDFCGVRSSAVVIRPDRLQRASSEGSS